MSSVLTLDNPGEIMRSFRISKGYSANEVANFMSIFGENTTYTQNQHISECEWLCSSKVKKWNDRVGKPSNGMINTFSNLSNYSVALGIDLPENSQFKNDLLTSINNIYDANFEFTNLFVPFAYDKKKLADAKKLSGILLYKLDSGSSYSDLEALLNKL